MSKKKCIGDHSIHICELADNDKQDEILKLVKEPHYMCFKCGRVAHEKKIFVTLWHLIKYPLPWLIRKQRHQPVPRTLYS